MNPEKKGWLKDYIEFRKEFMDKRDPTKKQAKARHPDESLYGILQPTGLMYGYPIQISKEISEKIENWDKQSKMKVLLAESLINSSLIYKNSNITSSEDLARAILDTSSKITSFYNKIYPELATSTTTFFGKKKPPLEVAEKIIEKRISSKKIKKENFWTYFFDNSLLFLDIYFFGQWINTSSEKMVSEFFKQEKEELQYTVVQVIVAAAHANDTIEDEERRFFEFFLESSSFSNEKKTEARQFLNRGISAEEIKLPENNSWILRKYFLELAILTVWADKKVEQSEVEFLEKFSKRLDLDEDDLENSMLAIEAFVIEHWDELGQLQDKQDLEEVSKKFIERVTKIIYKNKSRIAHEIGVNNKLKRLLEKSRHEDLNIEDQDNLRVELLSILKTIPPFVIVSLPDSFLSLPVLLQILPQSIFLTK